MNFVLVMFLGSLDSLTLLHVKNHGTTYHREVFLIIYKLGLPLILLKTKIWKSL